MEKIKVIIDTDPGVDDAACLVYAMFDKMLDIKLITTVVGNMKIETATRNTLHLLDKFNVDIDVAKGAPTAMKRISPTAEHIHSKEGLGGYNPPDISLVKHKLLKEDAVEAIYKVLKKGDGDIIPLLLGPHTNFGMLFEKHPDIIKKIPKIVFMGGAPYGMPGFPAHISFNVSSDPDAFKIVIDSKIPLVMVPSDMGRDKAHLEENYVYQVRDTNEVGKFLYEMFTKYWEPGYPDKRIATNDTCAYMYLIHPEIFTKELISLSVDTTSGKTIAKYDNYGHIELVVGVNREKFLEIMDKKLHEFDNFKLN